MNDNISNKGFVNKHERKAQLEIIGLVVIVIIVITGLLIFLVYKLSNPTRNIQRAYVNNEIATNILLSIDRVNVEECPSTRLEELITDCAKPNPSMLCSGYTSCEIINQTINRILINTLYKWDMSFRFSITSPYSTYPYGEFISFDNRNCTARVTQKVRGYALLPLYPVDGSAEMRLDICTKR
jgi:hypothetical protein